MNELLPSLIGVVPMLAQSAADAPSNSMQLGARLTLLVPEMILLAGACAVAVLGLSTNRALRDSCALVAAAILAVAGLAVFVVHTPERAASAELILPMLGRPMRIIVCVIGVLLCLTSAGFMDRRLEAAVLAGRAKFDPLRTSRGEYFAFLLLSLTGVNLIATASDLIWLFLALELTSLPTYIMVAISRASRKAQEAAVKYFFLGAMASAMFLYGFALLYGATGTLSLTQMQAVFAAQAAEGGLGTLAIIGLLLSVLGIGYKLAAAPMHFYAPDVYEGAASPVTAFLGFTPKMAGFGALMLLLAAVGWSGHLVGVDELGNAIEVGGLPQPVITVLWMVAALTMTLGNVGALLQSSVKRMLAYSSIAHTGYMIIGLIAGPERGFSAILFYMLSYGLMNTAAFAVISALERRGEEVSSLADLSGLYRRHPLLAAAMAVSAGSLIGMPPLLGFWSKLYLFVSGVEAGQIVLVVIACVNSAISAWYYLRLVGLPILSQPTPQAESVVLVPSRWPQVAAVLAAAALVVLPLGLSALVSFSEITQVATAR